MPTDNSHNEKQLLQHIALGDEQAMRSIFQIYFPRLWFFAESIIGNRESSRDIAQEALLQLWRERKKFGGQKNENLAAYLFTVVRRDCIDYNKHERVKRNKQYDISALIPVSEEGPDANLVYIEVLQKIYEEINKLPSHLSEIVKLSFLEGFTNQEIADHLHITANHVRVRKSRALEKLKNALVKQDMLAPYSLILLLF